MHVPLNHGKIWTSEEDELLLDLLGVYRIAHIAKRLRRKPNAIYRRLKELGYSNLSEETGTLRTHKLAEIVGVDPSTIIHWIKAYGLPTVQFHKGHKEKNKNRYHYIFPQDFWDWAKEHPNVVHFRKIKRGELLPEPEWLDEFVRNEQKAIRTHREWTLGEDRRLKDMIINQKLTQEEAGKQLGRSRLAVQRRIEYLDKQNMWPGEKVKLKIWTKEEVDKLLKLREEGLTFVQIGEKLERTWRSVQWKYQTIMKEEEQYEKSS